MKSYLLALLPIMALLALAFTLALPGCEPCAVVFGSHCQDRQREEDQDNADPPWWSRQQPHPLGGTQLPPIRG